MARLFVSKTNHSFPPPPTIRKKQSNGRGHGGTQDDFAKYRAAAPIDLTDDNLKVLIKKEKTSTLINAALQKMWDGKLGPPRPHNVFRLATWH